MSRFDPRLALGLLDVSARFKQGAGDDDAHDFVGAFEYLVHAEIAHDLFDAVVGEIAVASEELERLIGYVESGIGYEALGHGAEDGGVRVIIVECRGGAPEEGLRYFELGGMSTGSELEAYLYGVRAPSTHDHDVIAHALNERFAELDGLLLEALEKWETIEARGKA